MKTTASIIIASTLLTAPLFAQTTGTATTPNTNMTTGASGTVATPNINTTNNTNVNAGTTAKAPAANNINWKAENNYWRDAYAKRPYYNNSRNYSVYEPAYRYGVETYNRNRGRTYSDLSQEELNRGWSQARGNSNLTWEEAQVAVRDSYDRAFTNSNMNNTQR